jgi:hypothetical protein
LILAASPVSILLARAGNGGACCLVDVMVHGSVAVDVNVAWRGSDLRGDLIEAIGSDGAVRECKSNRRHEDAGQVNERDKAREPAYCVAGQDSKHRTTAFDRAGKKAHAPPNSAS